MNVATPISVGLPCWCGSEDVRVCWRRPTFGLTRCEACQSYRIDPPPLADDATCATFYNDYYESGLPGFRQYSQARHSRFWRVAAQQPALSRIENLAIDVGCGDGELCAELARAGWPQVIGFDISRSRIERARRQHPHLRFHETPIGAAGVTPGSADLAVMDNVIEHLPHPVDTLRELARYVSGTGLVVIITPNMESGHYRLLGRRWTPELAPHAHIYLFTAQSLRRLLASAGLRVEATGCFHEPGLPAAEIVSRAARGDVKGAMWRAMQDAGGLFGQLIGQGPMLFAIARSAAR
jgi:SAM-dependent methyltransferase